MEMCKAYVWTDRHVYGHVYMGMLMGMCMGMHMGMRMSMGVDICVDMQMGMRMDMHVGMSLDMWMHIYRKGGSSNPTFRFGKPKNFAIRANLLRATTCIWACV